MIKILIDLWLSLKMYLSHFFVYFPDKWLLFFFDVDFYVFLPFFIKYKEMLLDSETVEVDEKLMYQYYDLYKKGKIIAIFKSNWLLFFFKVFLIFFVIYLLYKFIVFLIDFWNENGRFF